MVVLLGILSAVNFLTARKKPQTECKVSASEASLTGTCISSRSEYQWSGVHKVSQNRSFVLIYVSPTMVLAIPKRSFATPAVAGLFHDYAYQQWAQARQANV